MSRSPISRICLGCGAAALITLGLCCGAGSAAAASSAGVSIDWQDPEPPAAQALAESVLNAPFNRDKISHLRMHITTLVDRTTGIEGFEVALDPNQLSLQDRLSALGAEETDTEIRIRLSGSILFDFDSAAIRPDAERSLGEVLEVIRAFPKRPIRFEVIIEKG